MDGSKRVPAEQRTHLLLAEGERGWSAFGSPSGLGALFSGAIPTSSGSELRVSVLHRPSMIIPKLITILDPSVHEKRKKSCTS